MSRSTRQPFHLTIPLSGHGDKALSADKPLAALICEAISLPAYDELPYIFDLERFELLEFTLRSDVPVDVLVAALCTRWGCAEGDHLLGPLRILR
jgi:hypothetical protein